MAKSKDIGIDKTFYFKLLERNGEQEYYYDYLIYAKDHEEAYQMADKYARNFYSDCDEKEEEYYLFDGGGLACRIEILHEMSKEDFVNMVVGSQLLTRERINSIEED